MPRFALVTVHMPGQLTCPAYPALSEVEGSAALPGAARILLSSRARVTSEGSAVSAVLSGRAGCPAQPSSRCLGFETAARFLLQHGHSCEPTRNFSRLPASHLPWSSTSANLDPNRCASSATAPAIAGPYLWLLSSGYRSG